MYLIEKIKRFPANSFFFVSLHIKLLVDIVCYQQISMLIIIKLAIVNCQISLQSIAFFINTWHAEFKNKMI